MSIASQVAAEGSADGHRYAVPIFVRPAVGDAYIGTGFVGITDRGPMLFTAAHLPTNRQPVIGANWLHWPDQIEVVVSPETQEPWPVAIFSTGPLGNRVPDFLWHLGSPGLLSDMMALPIHRAPNLAHTLVTNYTAIDLRTAARSPLTVGDVLECHGFPAPLDDVSTWPYHPARTTAGPLLEVIPGGTIEADMPNRKGFSGGPVFDSAGRLVGMLIGSTDGRARIVPRDSLEFLASL